MHVPPLAVLRRPLALLLAAATLTGAALTGATFAAPATAAGNGSLLTAARPRKPAPVTIGVASYNIKFGISPDKVVSDLTRLGNAGADVMGMQEMSARARRDAILARLVQCGTCPYDGYLPNDAPGKSAVPLLWKKSKFQLLETGSRLLSPATYVGPAGAGPATTTPKYVNYVKLGLRSSDRSLYVLNSHGVASVQAGGRPDYSNPRRLALYRQYMNGLRALITSLRATGSPVFSVGDFNVNYRTDSVVRSRLFPYYNMRQVDTYSSYEYLGTPATGTHRLPNGDASRLIDYVFFLKHPAVSPRSQQILRGYSSDHRPVLVTFALRASRA